MNTVVHNESADTRQTFIYFGWLTLFVYLATPGGYLVDIQTSYMLKNQLHATATQVSIFRLVTGIPVYFCVRLRPDARSVESAGIAGSRIFSDFRADHRNCICGDGFVAASRTRDC